MNRRSFPDAVEDDSRQGPDLAGHGYLLRRDILIRPCKERMSFETAIAIIPARLESTRLPGKILIEIEGKSLIQHVYERVKQAATLRRIIVATDSAKIAETVEKFGGTAMRTRGDHQSGTDRLAEVANQLDPDAIIVNVQGDEPMIEPAVIDQAVTAAQAKDAEMVTVMTRMDQRADTLDPNRVKVVTTPDGMAMYFSRSPIPWGGRCFLHLGLYVYRAGFLKVFSQLERTPLEIAERLEQLRALEHGYRIRVVEVESESWGIDTAADLEKFRERLEIRARGF
jgi:3-deoxy-manno-octulosonate cytidylyltransferase (CMP-KDO synthetase)